MYLFPQPTRLTENRGVTSAYINGDAIDEFVDRLNKSMGNRRFEEWIALLTFGGQVAAHILCAGYKNILVCTSYDNNDSGILTDADDDYNITGQEGVHMFPIIWKRMNIAGNIYVTMPPHTPSVFEKGYKEFNVPTIPVDQHYYIDYPHKYKLKAAPVDKFDAVVLLTPKRISAVNQKFKIEEVRKDFADYCKEDFDIITFFEPDCGISIIGSKKSKIRDILSFTSSQINPATYESKLKRTVTDVTGTKSVVQAVGYFNLRRFYNAVVNRFRIY